MLGDFYAKVGREEKYRPTIGKSSLHEITNKNGERLITFAISKNLLVKSTYFEHKDIHKYTWISPDGQTLNQIDHVLVDRRRHTNIMDVRSYRGGEGDTDHQLVITKVREKLCIASRESKGSKQRKFEVKLLDNPGIKADYQLEISNRFEILTDSSDNEDDISNNKEIDVNKMWEAIRDTVKSAAKERVGEKKRQKNKPWFDDECLKLHDERKQARQRWLGNKNEANTNNYKNAKRNATRGFRNKKREYLTQKIQEIEENGKTNNIRDLYKGVNSLRKGYQPRLDVIRNERGDLQADPTKIIDVWKSYFDKLLNVHNGEQRDLKSIPQNRGYPNLARSRSKCR